MNKQDLKIVIFSSNEPTITEQILKARQIAFKRVKGCFDGRLEDSFVVKHDDLAAIKSLNMLNGQTYVMLLDEARNASLVHLQTGETKELGLFQPVTKACAEHNGSYTLDNGNYYTTTLKV
jgi:hypothetical protein